jgi:hypothetical protein
MSHICGVSKTFGEWYQKTNRTEDTNKLTLLAFKRIAILHNTRLATFITLLETVSKGLVRNRSQNSCHTFLDCRRTPLIPMGTAKNFYEMYNHLDRRPQTGSPVLFWCNVLRKRDTWRTRNFCRQPTNVSP